MYLNNDLSYLLFKHTSTLCLIGSFRMGLSLHRRLPTAQLFPTFHCPEGLPRVPMAFPQRTRYGYRKRGPDQSVFAAPTPPLHMYRCVPPAAPTAIMPLAAQHPSEELCPNWPYVPTRTALDQDVLHLGAVDRRVAEGVPPSRRACCVATPPHLFEGSVQIVPDQHPAV